MRLRKPINYSTHAKTAIRERELNEKWVERAVRAPLWSERDPDNPVVERRYQQIAERDGRILRVFVVETDEEIRVITAFLDRRARRSG